MPVNTRPPTPGLPLLYGVFHTAVDAAAVYTVFRSVDLHELDPAWAFGLVVAYDILAFAPQFLLGWAMDRARAPRAWTLAGLASTALGAVLGLWLPVVAMLLVALGNALYHLGAGAVCLYLRPGRSAPAGVYVAFGALGLGIGIWAGKGGAVPLWALLLPLLVGMVVLWRVRNPVVPYDAPSNEQIRRDMGATDPRLGAPVLILVLLMLSVSVRSLVGMGGAWELERTTALLWGLPIVAFAGKALGGIVADRIGWIELSVGALLLSTPLLALGSASLPLVLLGLLLFQVTMAVTLAAATLVLPRRPGFAFGLTTLALIIGALPSLFHVDDWMYSPLFFAALLPLTAAVVWWGLRLLGGANPNPRTLRFLY